MKTIIDAIEAEKVQLASAEFFRWLATPSEGDREKLSFARGMCAYVMSFRDLLALIEVPETTSPIQQAINAYVAEDAPHYKWYLEDLNKISPEQFSPTELWAPQLLPSRRAIYRMISYALDNPPEYIKLILVAVFEATGAVFLGHTRMLLQRLGMDSELSYFGTTHYEDEVGHSVDFSTLSSAVLSDEERAFARDMVSKAFSEYYGLFESWRLHALRA
jgi:hypothetical protein